MRWLRSLRTGQFRVLLHPAAGSLHSRHRVHIVNELSKGSGSFGPWSAGLLAGS